METRRETERRAEEDRIALNRTARMRAHHSWRPRVTESVCVRTGDSGPSADPPGSTSRRSASEKARQSRARRQGSSSAFVSSVRQATGKTKLKMPLGNHAALTPLEDMSAGRGQAGGGPPQNCQKVFIQRDYSEGTMVKFQTRFPTELESRLDRQLFEYTINQLNNYFAEAERASCSTYCESCLYCLTGYLISICTETHYEKCLRKVAKFVSEQNDRVYKPRGLLLTDPTTRGLRLIEISVLDRPAS